tara:strand:+ start:1488 stop:1805 length:318 start_codon:yes stop_codon:yes gene_type:complete
MKLQQQQIPRVEAILNSIEEKIEQMELDLYGVPKKDLLTLKGMLKNLRDEIGMVDYLNKRVRIRNEEFYGKVLREFSSEVLVEVEDIAKDNQLYFNKSEVEIVDE